MKNSIGLVFAKDMGKNGWGNPGQRKPVEEKPKRTEAELIQRLHYNLRKLVKDKDKAERIIELLVEVGL